jgi:CBS domain-containing protein
MTVVTVRSDQSIRDAVTLLAMHNIGALVVVDEAGKPAGIISERDIVREASRSETVFNQAIRQVMTVPVITGTAQDDVRSVLQTMTDKHFRHLPITDQGKLVGIVSIGDLVKAQLEEYEGAIDTLQTQITGGTD